MFRLKHHISEDPVHAVTIGGERPSDEEVSAVRAELAKVPLCFRQHWWRRGGRCDVVPGHNASIHPRFSRNGQRAAGWCGPELLTAVAASSPDAATHELGHAVGEFTGADESKTWLRIFENEKRPPVDVPDLYLHDPREMFAYYFQLFFCGAFGQSWKRRLENMKPTLARFMQTLETSIEKAVADEATVDVLYR